MTKKVLRCKFSSCADGFRESQLDYRDYDYFWDGEAAEGDFAVVNVNGAYKVVLVREVLLTSSKATKWAVTVFNKKALEERLARERQLEDLKASMRQRLESLKEMTKFEEAASADAVMKDLFDQFNSIQETK